DTETVTIISTGAELGTLSASLCAGGEYVIASDTFTSSGVFDVLFAGGAVNGCDSIVRLTLTVDPLPVSAIAAVICEGDVFSYSGVDYAVAGQYVLDTLPAVTGCDTILTLNLAVDTFPVLYVDPSICTGETY